MEEYEIISVRGFQITGNKYYSRVYGSIEEAESEKKLLTQTVKREQTEVRNYTKRKKK